MIFSYFNYLLYINSSFTLNCKVVVARNKDWFSPALHKDFHAWAEHNNMVLTPAKVKLPRWKSVAESHVKLISS